jgi:alanine dehydrogenase
VANEKIENVSRACRIRDTQIPAKSYFYFSKGDLRSMSAYISGDGFGIAGVKCVNVPPQNTAEHLPTVMAVIILNNPQTGFPMAIMDGTYLVCLRTGAAGAVASQYLSQENEEVGGFFGCDTQAQTKLSCSGSSQNKED